MNVWLAGAAGMLLSMAVGGAALLRGPILSRLVALQFLGGVTTLVLLMLPTALGRPDLFDTAETMALMTAPSSLVYAFVYVRWLAC